MHSFKIRFQLRVIDKYVIHHLVGFLKYKNVFAKINVPNWTEEVFALKEMTDTIPWLLKI